MPEVVAIAWATGHTVAQLAGAGAMADRAQYAARATNDSGMNRMREALLHFLDDLLLGSLRRAAWREAGARIVSGLELGRRCLVIRVGVVFVGVGLVVISARQRVPSLPCAQQNLPRGVRNVILPPDHVRHLH